jgi:DNA-binding NarL/FixJ family response regulator
VLLPGVPFNNFVEEWRIPPLRDVYERLAERLKIVQYDGRGTGHSQRDVADVSLDGMLRDLDAVVGQARLEQFALLGFYNSCTHALAYAARHPERVTRVVLFGGSSRGWLAMNAPQTQALLSLIDRDWNVFAETAAHQWMGWTVGEAGRLAAESFRSATTPTVARATMQAASGIDVSSELPKVRAPTLVLHRAGMPQIPLDVSQALADALPNGRLHLLTGTSAALFFENVDEVIDVIVGFVSTGTVPQRSLRARQPSVADTHGLTSRELDVLRLLAHGETNAEIAHRLKVSIHTVERHVANLYRKIDARGRADATAFAVRTGLG